MGTEIIEMGKISSRGQIAIPADIRQELDLNEGNKVLFVLEDDTLIMKKVTSKSFREITKPLKEAAKNIGLKESDVEGLVHRARKR